MDIFYNPQHAYRSSINIRPPCADKNKHNEHQTTIHKLNKHNEHEKDNHIKLVHQYL